MRFSYSRRIRPIMLTVTAVIGAISAVLTLGAGTSFARGISASHYYEDTSGNVCVGLEEVGGFVGKSCEWGEQTGLEDVGLGERVLEHGTSESYDVAVGHEALAYDKTGSYDAAVGWHACLHNESGAGNTCTGSAASLRDTTGGYNVSNGDEALLLNTTGSDNVGLGAGALHNLLEGSHDVAVGEGAGTAFTGSESNNVDIANEGVKADSGTTRIGTESKQTRAFMAGIYEKTISTPTCTVIVNSSGQLGCKAMESGAKSAGSTTDAASLEQANAKIERQQQEIETLASELKSLRRK